MMPYSVRAGFCSIWPIIGFTVTFWREAELSTNPSGSADLGNMRIPQHNATHNISIPGNRRFRGDLAAIFRDIRCRAKAEIARALPIDAQWL